MLRMLYRIAPSLEDPMDFPEATSNLLYPSDYEAGTGSAAKPKKICQ